MTHAEPHLTISSSIPLSYLPAAERAFMLRVLREQNPALRMAPPPGKARFRGRFADLPDFAGLVVTQHAFFPAAPKKLGDGVTLLANPDPHDPAPRIKFVPEIMAMAPRPSARRVRSPQRPLWRPSPSMAMRRPSGLAGGPAG